MSTVKALEKAVEDKVKEYTKIANAERKAGRELSEGFRNLDEIRERARQVVMNEMNAMISAHFTEVSGKEVYDSTPSKANTAGAGHKDPLSGSPVVSAASVSAGPMLGGGRVTAKYPQGVPFILGGGAAKSEQGVKGDDDENHQIGAEWKVLDGLEQKKV